RLRLCQRRGVVHIGQVEEEHGNLPEFGQPVAMSSPQPSDESCRDVRLQRSLHGRCEHRPHSWLEREGCPEPFQAEMAGGERLSNTVMLHQVSGDWREDNLTWLSLLLSQTRLHQGCAGDRKLPAVTHTPDMH